jgi:hypothetical protein
VAVSGGALVWCVSVTGRQAMINVATESNKNRRLKALMTQLLTNNLG